MPCGICNKCLFYLSKASNEEEISLQDLGSMKRFEDKPGKHLVKIFKLKCECAVCQHGRMNGHGWKIFRKNSISKRPVMNKTENLCANCFSYIKKGSKRSIIHAKVKKKLNNIKHLLDKRVKYFFLNALLIFY